MAARIEVVFILLIGLEGFCFGIRVVLRILLRMIEERRIVSLSKRLLLYIFSTAFGLGRQAYCGRRRISLCHAQLLTEWSLSEFCVTEGYRLSHLAERRTRTSGGVLGGLGMSQQYNVRAAPRNLSIGVQCSNGV